MSRLLRSSEVHTDAESQDVASAIAAYMAGHLELREALLEGCSLFDVVATGEAEPGQTDRTAEIVSRLEEQVLGIAQQVLHCLFLCPQQPLAGHAQALVNIGWPTSLDISSPA